MRAHPYCELPDGELLYLLAELNRRERVTTAELIACIAEVDGRRLYLTNGCSSMFVYCVEILGLSDDAAYKRIQAARVIRKYPLVFEALKEGRLQLSGIGVLAPHLTESNAERLLGEAEGCSIREIEELVARRKPKTEALPMVQAIPAAATPAQLATSQVLNAAAEHEKNITEHPVAAHARIAPIAQERYSVQITLGKSGRENLEALRDLLSHRIPSGDLNEIADYAFSLVRRMAEKRKFGATSRPRTPRTGRPKNQRAIPAHVRRTVRERDGDRCTFIGENGHRCTSRRFLEFDHIRPFARGAETTAENLRLRCRAHNQLEAERVYGPAFMQTKRDEAGRADDDILNGLRNLGFRVDQARSAAIHVSTLRGATLEQGMREALAFLRPRRHRA